MTYVCVCPLCNELREAVLDATERHMATMLQLDKVEQATKRSATGHLGRKLEADRRRLDDAKGAYEAHQQVHMELGLVA